MKEVTMSIAKHNGLLDKAKQLESELTVLSRNKSETHGLSNGPELSGSKSPKYRSSVNTSTSPKRAVTQRRKSDGKGRGVVSRAGGGGGGAGHVGMDNFDAHIKSIITNALMADQSADKARITSANTGTISSGKELLTKAHITEHNRKQTVTKERVSLPVKLPLSEMTGKHSLPVSIPLKELSEVHSKHSHHSRVDHRDESRDTYSPISNSRPSSSSSTMSADSVRNLPNGASDCPSLSPPYAAPIMHPSAPRGKLDQGAIDSRQIQAGIQASLALGYRPSYMPPSSQQSGPMYNNQGNAIDHFLHDKQLAGRDGKYATPNHLTGLNGFNRVTPPQCKTTPSPVKSASPAKAMPFIPNISEDRGRRGRRKRTYSGGRSPPSAVKRPAGGRAVANEVAAMVSAASQPLAISSISDAESSTKSSPGLGTSPTKLPPHMLPEGMY